MPDHHAPLTPLTLFDLAAAHILSRPSMRSNRDAFQLAQQTLASVRADLLASDAEGCRAALAELLSCYNELPDWTQHELVTFTARCMLQGILGAALTVIAAEGTLQ